MTSDIEPKTGVDSTQGDTKCRTQGGSRGVEGAGTTKRVIKGRKNGKGVERSKTPDSYTPEQIQQIEEMAESQCKDTTIAVAMGFDVDTFRRDHASRTEKKRAEGKANILRAQYAMAQNQPVMGIWFGKQHLEQRDKQEVEHSGKGLDAFLAFLKDTASGERNLTDNG